MLTLTSQFFIYGDQSADTAIAYLLDADLTEPLDRSSDVTALSVGTIAYERTFDPNAGTISFTYNPESIYNSPVIGDVTIRGVSYVTGRGHMSESTADVTIAVAHDLYVCSNRLDLLGFTTQDLTKLDRFPASAGDLLVDLNGDCLVTNITGIANEEIVLSALIGDTWTELGPLPQTLDSVVMSKLRIVKSDGTRVSEVPIIFVEGRHVVPKQYDVRTVAVTFPIITITGYDTPKVFMSSGFASDSPEVPTVTLNPKQGAVASLIHIPDLNLTCMESISNVIK